MTKISKEKYGIQSLLSRVHMKDRSDKSFPVNNLSHHLKALSLVWSL